MTQELKNALTGLRVPGRWSPDAKMDIDEGDFGADFSSWVEPTVLVDATSPRLLINTNGGSRRYALAVHNGLTGEDAAWVLFPVAGDTYILPAATAETLGGIKIGSGLEITDGVASVSGAGAIAAAFAAGAGVVGDYPKTTDGAQTLAAADTVNERVVLGIVTVTEVFADGDGTQPTFIIGETDTTNKFLAVDALASAALGAQFFFAGTLSATKALLVTGGAATGTGTGAIAVTTFVFPAAV